MYSGLLPQGLTEADLSSDDDDSVQTQERGGTSKRYPENVNDVRQTSVSVEDVGTSCTLSDPESPSPKRGLPGISHDTWQKFQKLKKKKHEVKMMKPPRRRHRKKHKKGEEEQESTEQREHQVEHEKHWNGLKQYFGVNDRFQPPGCGKPPPKSGLEKSIESAIAEGDIEKAEEMSDRLATRELAVKIAHAADCRDFVQRKQEEEDLQAAQKRKKQIAWGFEAKKRWETKSNMGYM
ncbi:protein FAM204A [Lampris incognitus]|uniref:protein FAM204A n=1 Tax=Lampris incognitus TaxID=2546036 RepID=UPI0024B58419|nr:protein FAM204A [Lampris incognitus]